MTKSCKLLALIVLVSGLAACASGVNKSTTSSNYQYQGQKFSSVKVSLNDNAQAKLQDNIKFDSQKFEQIISRTMQANGLIDTASGNRVDVQVTDIRVRSTFSAVMWGFMAGNDRVVGTVSLKQTSGAPVHEFEVSASYALGGWGGGQDDSRMNWLYEEFAKLTVNEIMGRKEGKVSQLDR